MPPTRTLTVIAGLLATVRMAGAGDVPIFLGAPVEPAAGLGRPAGVTPLPEAGPSFRVGGLIRTESRVGRGSPVGPSAIVTPGGITPNGPLAPMRRASRLTSHPDARLDLDARIPTGYGPLRGYVSVRAR